MHRAERVVGLAGRGGNSHGSNSGKARIGRGRSRLLEHPHEVILHIWGELSQGMRDDDG